MLKISLMAAAVWVASGLTASADAASDMRAQNHCSFDCPAQNHGDSGVNRYCPPGQVPHSFPNGNGIRCETLDGDWR